MLYGPTTKRYPPYIHDVIAGPFSAAIVVLIIYIGIITYLSKAYEGKIEYIEDFTNKLPAKVWSSIAIVYFILSSFINTYCMKFLL